MLFFLLFSCQVDSFLLHCSVSYPSSLLPICQLSRYSPRPWFGSKCIPICTNRTVLNCLISLSSVLLSMCKEFLLTGDGLPTSLCHVYFLVRMTSHPTARVSDVGYKLSVCSLQNRKFVFVESRRINSDPTSLKRVL